MKIGIYTQKIQKRSMFEQNVQKNQLVHTFIFNLGFDPFSLTI